MSEAAGAAVDQSHTGITHQQMTSGLDHSEVIISRVSKLNNMISSSRNVMEKHLKSRSN